VGSKLSSQILSEVLLAGYMLQVSGSTLSSAMTPKLKLSLSWLVRASAVPGRLRWLAFTHIPASCETSEGITPLRSDALSLRVRG
jgi:hypothetical protein